MSETKDGIIYPAPPPAPWGFSTEDFTPDSYLWRIGDEIIVPLVRARHPGTGAFSRLVRTIERNGKRVAVSTPVGPMKDILRHLGFAEGWVNDPEVGRVEVWRKPAVEKSNA
jgi:hypothetical protein